MALASLTVGVHGRYGGASMRETKDLLGLEGSLAQPETPSAQTDAGLEAAEIGEPLSKMKINAAVVWLEDHERLIDFYTQFTGNTQVTAIILEMALVLEIPINLAFSLAWKESRFDYKAISPPNRGGSRDWGLFQLNDRGRSEWTREQFFNLRRNAYSGLYYLKHCIETMGDIRMGLAAYNAGVYGVKARGVPRSTRRYIEAIFEYEAALDQAFADWIGGNQRMGS
jgi:hypothetical protein